MQETAEVEDHDGFNQHKEEADVVDYPNKLKQHYDKKHQKMKKYTQNRTN